MERYTLKEDVSALGMEVKTFPVGIGEAFDALANMLPEGFERSYYGISYFSDGGKIIYHAAAHEKFKGEAEKYNRQHYVIEKGEYIAATIRDWRKNLDRIKDIFD